MEIVIVLFFVALTLLVVLPTLPNSRRVRVALAVLSIPGIICAYRLLEMFATIGVHSAHLDEFIRKSGQLLSEGKIEEVQTVLADYRKKRGELTPASTALAARTSLLYHLIKEKEEEMTQKSDALGKVRGL